MALENIDDWVSRARAAVESVMDGFEQLMGYEPDAQQIRLADRPTPLDLSNLPDQVRAFFAVVDEISWPDISNGYFFGPARETIRRHHQQEPGRVEVGSQLHQALAIGSDGGGAYFVLDLDAHGKVLRVSGATVLGGVLRGTAEEVAEDLDHFLERLLENVRLVAAGQQPAF